MRRLRVWWIPQIPMKAFAVDVQNFVEAKLLLDTLADYDLFQFKNRVKPDYANVGGLTEWDDADEEYLDWHPDEAEQEILNVLFGHDSDIAFSDDPLDEMTLEQVRQFQAKLDALEKKQWAP